MISPLLPSHDADTVALDFGVFIAERARTYRCSREAIIAAVLQTIPLTPPPQPGETSRSHAPAAQTDGAAGVLPAEPSVDLSGLAAHEQGPILSPAVPPAGDAADGQAETLLSEPSAAPTLRDRIVAAHREHPDWPPKLLAEHCGTREEQVRNAAQKRHLKLPTWWEYQRSLQAKTTEALKAAPAEPQEAVAPPPEPEAQPEPEQPPADTQSPPLPPPAIKVMRSAPTGRFYLRERTPVGTEGRFVHQALQPCPTGPGPLMTIDRKWAWYDTMERFKGAVKKWPELKDMRKEAANG